MKCDFKGRAETLCSAATCLVKAGTLSLGVSPAVFCGPMAVDYLGNWSTPKPSGSKL